MWASSSEQEIWICWRGSRWNISLVQGSRWCWQNSVRLKIGDPFLFGRGGEEILEFRKWGIEPLIAPGISASYSAPLAAHIQLTHTGTSNQVQISTGYGIEFSTVDLPAYSPDRTIVLLMAVGLIADITKQLMAYRYPPSLPVAISHSFPAHTHWRIRGHRSSSRNRICKSSLNYCNRRRTACITFAIVTLS